MGWKEGALPGAQLHLSDVKARDLDGDEALEDHVDAEPRSDGQLLEQGDLGVEGDGGAGLDEDGEGLDADVVQCGRLRTSI